jgi:probable rRNA maturation factor
MEVLIRQRWKLAPGEGRELSALTRQTVRRVLELANAPEEAEVSVLFVGDEEMRELNAKYRGIDRATDVLAFAMTEGKAFPPPEGARLLGDVVVSVETAGRQARAASHSLRREIAVLLVHGVLHLLGHDHEAGQRDRDKRLRMRRLEKECIGRLESRLLI